MNRWKAACCIFTILFFLTKSPNGISASVEESYDTVHINEIMPDPEGSDLDYEWLELYNPSDEDVDLSLCTIDDRQFPEGTFILTHNFLVVAKDVYDSDGDGKSFEQRYGNGSKIWGDAEEEDFGVVEIGITLKNSEDELFLTCSDYMDDVLWDSTSTGRSISLFHTVWRDDLNVTPGSSNTEPEPIVYNHGIVISEVYPTTREDEFEWIEIFNSSDQSISLQNWLLEDSSKRITLHSLTVSARSHYVLKEEDLTVTLNDSGEVIVLYDPNGDEVNRFEYNETKKGISNIRQWRDGHYGDEIVQTQFVTISGKNEYVSPDDVFYGKTDIPISVAKQQIGEQVVVKGFVTVESDVIGSRVLYIQDEDEGIQIHLAAGMQKNDFILGTELRIFGKVLENRGEKRINVEEDNWMKRLHGNYNIAGEKINTGKVEMSDVGKLVIVVGRIVETSGSTFYADDNSGVIKILVKDMTGIDLPEKRKGDWAAIAGILSQYGVDKDSNPSFRILPRYSRDVVISDEPLEIDALLVQTGGNLIYLLSAGLTICLYAIITYVCSCVKFQNNSIQ